MSTPTADPNPPLPVSEAVERLALQEAYKHRPEPFEAEFAQLACACPDACSCDNDYPAWAAAMAANQTTPKEAS